MGLAQQQMNMVWHDDVAENIELVALPQFFEGFLEDDAGMLGLKPRLMPEATEIDGVVMAVLLESLQAARHGENFSLERHEQGWASTLERQKQGWPTHRGFLRWVGWH